MRLEIATGSRVVKVVSPLDPFNGDAVPNNGRERGVRPIRSLPIAVRGGRVGFEGDTRAIQ
jgi:hypothetical protein